MTPAFWIKRFFIVFLGVFALLLVVGLLKHRSLEEAATDSAIWAGVSAVIFVSARFFQARRGQHCALCRDTPQMAEADRTEVSSAAHPKK